MKTVLRLVVILALAVCGSNAFASIEVDFNLKYTGYSHETTQLFSLTSFVPPITRSVTIVMSDLNNIVGPDLLGGGLTGWTFRPGSTLPDFGTLDLTNSNIFSLYGPLGYSSANPTD